VDGGVTPSIGKVAAVVAALGPDFPVFVLVRPRPGDFLYSSEEVGTPGIASVEAAGGTWVSLRAYVQLQHSSLAVMVVAPLPVTAPSPDSPPHGNAPPQVDVMTRDVLAVKGVGARCVCVRSACPVCVSVAVACSGAPRCAAHWVLRCCFRSCSGVVVGCLTSDGDVDEPMLMGLVAAARPLR
jgi:hypothetical protein